MTMMMMMAMMTMMTMMVMMLMMVLMLTPPGQNTPGANTIQMRGHKKGFLKQKGMVLMFFGAVRRWVRKSHKKLEAQKRFWSSIESVPASSKELMMTMTTTRIMMTRTMTMTMMMMG